MRDWAVVCFRLSRVRVFLVDGMWHIACLGEAMFIRSMCAKFFI